MTVPRLPPVSHALRRSVQLTVADIDESRLILVACSGGPDSLALAAAAAASGRRVRAVVVDHGLQPASAAVAGEVVRALERLGLSASIRQVDVGLAGGPEAAARSARYEVLAESAAESGAACVLLGHTRDDQAESVLLGLARGSGTRSLAGMPPRRGLYRRPFLDVPRSTIEQSLDELGLRPWRDPHNDDPQYARVRVRTTVLPVLERELGPGVAAALARTASLARDDADALDLLAQQQLAGAGQWQTDDLAALPRAIRSRMIRIQAFDHGCPRDALTARHVDDVDRLVTDWHGQGPLQLPGGVIVRRRYGRLVFEHDESHAESGSD